MNPQRFLGAMVCAALSAVSQPVQAQIPPGPPCTWATQVSNVYTEAICPFVDDSRTRSWRLSCHPMCGYEQISYFSATSHGGCFQYFLVGRHCPAFGPFLARYPHHFEGQWNTAIGVNILGKCVYQTSTATIPCQGCDERPPCDDPLIISIKDAKYELTDTKGGVQFDLNGDGELEQIPWIAGPDDAFIVLDRNSNGQIDDGRELFSHASPQIQSASPNGFLALGMFDDPLNGGDGDSKINSADEIFESLRLWVDRDIDGHTDPGELLTLDDVGLIEIELKYTDADAHPDKHGNTFKYSAPAYFDDRRVVDAWVVFFNLDSCPASKQ